MSDQHYRNARWYEPRPTHWLRSVQGRLYAQNAAWAAGTEAVVLASVLALAVVEGVVFAMRRGNQ